MKRCILLGLALSLPVTVSGQAINIDIGAPGDGPSPGYAAAGLSGIWNSLEAAHGTTTGGIVDVDGHPTPVTLNQFGGLELVSADDPSTPPGDPSRLLDDYLVTFDPALESCVFFANVAAGEYEVLLYAWMPNAPGVDSYTDVDQEPGNPHLEVGGAWPGQHQELVTYSRHVATVGGDGALWLHSGIVPGAEPTLGAALNGIQIRPVDLLFSDSFESGDLSRWVAVP